MSLPPRRSRLESSLATRRFFPGVLLVNLSTSLRGERFVFADLRELFARASEPKSGDQLAGLAARCERERVAAKLVLADLTLQEVVEHPLIDPDADEVSRLILDQIEDPQPVDKELSQG